MSGGTYRSGGGGGKRRREYWWTPPDEDDMTGSEADRPTPALVAFQSWGKAKWDVVVMAGDVVIDPSWLEGGWS